MNKSKKTLLLVLIIFLAIAGLFTWNLKSPGQYDELAICLKDKGVKFYGAFWCPACEQQKALFGKSTKKLPYVECSPTNKQGQFPVCVEEEVKAYPTWKFADNTSQTGVMSLSDLADRSGCVLP